jgi:hypothetical protein
LVRAFCDEACKVTGIFIDVQDAAVHGENHEAGLHRRERTGREV